MIIKIKNIYYFKDPCNRHWELTPVHNCNIQVPFLTKPITEEKFHEAIKEGNGHVVG